MNYRLVLFPLLIASFLYVQSGEAAAQSSVGGWTTLAGGDEIISLAIDPQSPNLLWVGTEGGGVVVWDLDESPASWIEQHVYPDQPGLRSNTIYDITFYESDVWLATAAGVTKVSAAGDWTTYDTHDGLPSLEITAVAVDGDGTVWAGTHNEGAAAMRSGTQSWTVHTLNEDEPDQGPGADKIADIAVDYGNTGLVYFAHGRSDASVRPALSLYDPSTDAWDTIESVGPGGDPTIGPAGDQIMALSFDQVTGELWLGSWAEGVLYYDGAGWDQHEPSDGLCGKSVWAIEAQDGEVWAACGDDSDGDGVSQWTPQGWATWSTPDLPTSVVTAFAISNGLTYLGTNGPKYAGSGIVPFDVEPLDPLTTAPDLPYSNDILAMLFDDQGAQWVGTQGSGLMRYDGVWEQFTVDNTDGLLVGDVVTDLALRRGQLWIASTKILPSGTADSDGGISIVDIASLEWEPPMQQDDSVDCMGLPDNEASSVSIGNDTDEKVWIGIGIGSGGPGYASASHQGEGVVSYDPETDEWQCFTFENTGGGPGLAGNTVLDLAITGDELWAAAAYHTSAVDGRKYGGGISKLLADEWTMWGDGDENFVTYSVPDTQQDRDPITGDVRSTFVDSGGRAWAGTWDLETGDAVYIWPFVDAIVNRYETNTWVFDRFVGSGWTSALAEDGQGMMWAGTTRGHIQEYSPTGRVPQDTATGGVRVWDGGDWLPIVPPESAASGIEASGIAAKAVTAIEVDPTSGDVWIGTENGGFSIYSAGEPIATATHDPSAGTAVPTGPPTATRQVIATVAPSSTSSQPGPSATSGPAPTPTDEDNPDEPQPPPEVPEPSTIILLGAGLAGLAAWAAVRRRAA